MMEFPAIPFNQKSSVITSIARTWQGKGCHG